MINVPIWLQPGVRIDENDKRRLLLINRNWLTIFAARKELTEEDCLKLIILEICGKKRLDVIHKVKVWFDKRRSERENKDISNAL